VVALFLLVGSPVVITSASEPTRTRQLLGLTLPPAWTSQWDGATGVCSLIATTPAARRGPGNLSHAVGYLGLLWKGNPPWVSRCP
jgi:hypothetical protein